MKPVADYQSHCEAFKSLLTQSCAKRILLVEGCAGMGKRTLITRCLSLIPPNIYQVSMDVRGITMTILEIFSKIVTRVGRSHFSCFNQQLESLSKIPSVNISDNQQLGMNNQISVALRVKDPLDREERRVLLTEAWFKDASQLDQLCVLLMNTFHEANTEVKDWITTAFLPRVSNTESVRVMIAGEQVPDVTIDWHDCCQKHELRGVREAKDWLPIVEKLRKRPPPEVEHFPSFLQGVCSAFEGRPEAIMKLIYGLPNHD